MDKGLYDKVAEELEEQGIEVLGEAKDRRSSLFRVGMWLSGRPLHDVDIVDVIEDKSKKKLIVVQKKRAEEEYQSLRKIHELQGNYLKVPRPYLFLENYNAVVTEYMEKSLSEMIILNSFLLGPSKNDFQSFFKKLGQNLAEFHNSTMDDDRINIEKSIEKRLKSLEEVLDEDLIEEIKGNVYDISVPRALIHNDLNIRHVRWMKGEPSIIDWSGSKYGSPLRDVHFLDHFFRKRNHFLLRPNLEELSNEFIDEYKKSIDFELPEDMFYSTKLNFILERIDHRPKNANERTYRNALNQSLNKLGK